MNTMNQPDYPFCTKYEDLIKRYFSLLLQQHDYKLIFLKRIGRYGSECVFGMQSEGKPNFQFGGETGPYIAIAAPTVPFSLSGEGGVEPPWLFITAIDDYLAGRKAKWKIDNIDTWEETLEDLSRKTIKLLPWLLDTFSNEQLLAIWRVDYEKWAVNKLDEYKKR
jgi:hypothetical protein